MAPKDKDLLIARLTNNLNRAMAFIALPKNKPYTIGEKTMETKKIYANELNRLEANSYEYLRNTLAYKDNFIISRVNNPEMKNNNLICFKVEDKNLDNDLTFFTLTMRRSITKYFQIIKTEKSCLAIRK